MQNSQYSKPPRRTRRGLVVIIAVASALLCGAGVFFWQQYRLHSETAKWKTTNEEQQHTIEVLNKDLEDVKGRKSQMESEWEKGRDFEMINDFCDLKECLLTHSYGKSSGYDLTGTAVIRGYFSTAERTAWDNTFECDCITITGGSQPIIKFFTDLVDQGNTVNSLNHMREPEVTPGLELLTPQEAKLITSSTPDHQVELLVLMKSHDGRGADGCEPGFTVLRVL